jgi:hypothetical protein
MAFAAASELLGPEIELLLQRERPRKAATGDIKRCGVT